LHLLLSKAMRFLSNKLTRKNISGPSKAEWIGRSDRIVSAIQKMHGDRYAKSDPIFEKNPELEFDAKISDRSEVCAIYEKSEGEMAWMGTDSQIEAATDAADTEIQRQRESITSNSTIKKRLKKYDSVTLNLSRFHQKCR
jgi:hypothetical protein